VDGSASPQLSSVLALLRPLGMGLAVVPREEDAPSEEDVLAGWLAHYGAPLYGAGVLGSSKTLTVEEALLSGLTLSRESGTVARALPCAFWANREKLNLHSLSVACERSGQARTLGFFLDLTSVVAGKSAGPAFEKVARALRDRYSPLPLLSRPVQFFRPTTRRERVLAESVTPGVARRWGFRMNMDLECFASMFRKTTS